VTGINRQFIKTTKIPIEIFICSIIKKLHWI